MVATILVAWFTVGMADEHVTMSVRMPVRLKRRLAAEAARQDRSQNYVTVKALEQALGKKAGHDAPPG